MATCQSVDFFKDKSGVPRPIIATGMLGDRIDDHNLVVDRLYGLSAHGRWGAEHAPTTLKVGARYAVDNNAYVYGVVAGLTNGTIEEWLNSRNRPGVSPWATLHLESVNTERVPVMSMKGLSGYSGIDSDSINGKEEMARIGDGFSCCSLWSQFNSDGTLRAAVVGHLNGEVLCLSTKNKRFFQLHPPYPWVPQPFLIYDMNVEAVE